MFEEFVGLISDLFPSVDPAAAMRCLRELARGDIDPQRLFCPGPLEYLAQGDILAPMTFLKIDDPEEPDQYDGPGVVVSNTCDAENDEHILLAASFPLAKFLGANVTPEETVRTNCIFNLFYLPWTSENGRGLVTDLSWVQTYSRANVVSSLQAGRVRKLCSLWQAGFYLLLAKLTVHLLRPENEETLRERSLDGAL